MTRKQVCPACGVRYAASALTRHMKAWTCLHNQAERDALAPVETAMRARGWVRAGSAAALLIRIKRDDHLPVAEYAAGHASAYRDANTKAVSANISEQWWGPKWAVLVAREAGLQPRVRRDVIRWLAVPGHEEDRQIIATTLKLTVAGRRGEYTRLAAVMHVWLRVGRAQGRRRYALSQVFSSTARIAYLTSDLAALMEEV
jgi:hypothetical protein